MSTAVPRVPIGETYAVLLDRLAEAGYEARQFDAFDVEARHVILRHDIDACPDRALRMATLEADRGWSGLYFVQLTSAFYNPLAPVVKTTLRKCLALGHEIGLHLEVEPGATRSSLEAAAREQTQILSDLLGGTEVKWMSFHRPASNAEALAEFINAPKFAGLKNAYADQYGEAGGLAYRSDSGGKWYASHPLEHPRVLAGKALHLLTHPVWWFGEDPTDSIATARRFCDEHDRAFRDEVSGQFLQRAGRPDLCRT